MKENKTICVDPEVWKELERMAEENYTSKSDMVQRLILRQVKENAENN